MKCLIFIQVILNIAQVNCFRAADMSIFGPCVIHIKMFRDSRLIEDLSSIIINAQLISRREALFSIFNGTDLDSQIQPIGSVYEKCSVNVMVGVQPRHDKLLHDWMYTSAYTFSQKPHSIYVIALDSETNSMMIDKATIMLPVSIFVINIYTNSVELESEPRFWYYCSSCTYPLQPVLNKNNIRLLSDSNYERKWQYPKLNLQAKVSRITGEITLCEKYIWEKWLASFDDDIRETYSVCSKSFSFLDLVARSTHPNMTISLVNVVNRMSDGFSGQLIYGSWTTANHLDPWLASSTYFHRPAAATIIYCNCDRQSDVSTFESCVKCFSLTLWLSIFGICALVQMYLSATQFTKQGTLAFGLFLELIMNVISLVVRQGNCTTRVLALFSFVMFLVTSLYENSMTSDIIVPAVKPEMELSQLILSGYKVLYVGANTYRSQIDSVKEAFKLSRTPFDSSKVHLMTNAMFTDPKTFSSDKNGYFVVATENSRKIILGRIQSYVPSHCWCTSVKNELQSFRTFSGYKHRLTEKIFRYINLLNQAGIDQLFDQDITQASSDISDEKKFHKQNVSSGDHYVSLKNLLPLFFGLFGLVGISKVLFLAEMVWMNKLGSYFSYSK
jgi:hypothetical protein